MLSHDTIKFFTLWAFTLLSCTATTFNDNNEILKVYNFKNTNRRNLQFEGMFEGKTNQKYKKKKGGLSVKASRSQALTKAVEEILLDSDRYHLWWTGPPPESDAFKPADWSVSHRPDSNAIFTMAVIQGQDDKASCSSPNDLILYLGTARKEFDGDIVLALEADVVTDEVKAILTHYKAVVYVLPKDLCSKASKSIFCGSEDERVPASVFRYYFYERWAALYSSASLLLLTDFRDILFQGDPFAYRLSEWYPEYQLVVFQEFHPNMVIGRCVFNRRVMSECYGEESLRMFGNRVIVSSGAVQGTRDAMVLWTHHMTRQIQEAPGRMVETRCTSGGIDHSFVNWLVYGNKLRQLVRIRVYPQGEGALNTLGGLRPDTVVANITGTIKQFWKVLDDGGHVLNWNGEVSPVVHQLDHFQDELIGIADQLLLREPLAQQYRPHHSSPNSKRATLDRAWQAIAVSRCLFDCAGSRNFSDVASLHHTTAAN